MKVIYLISGKIENKGSYYPIDSDQFYLFGIGQFIAREFIKRGYDIEPEIWRVDGRIKKLKEKRIDGIFCRIFPKAFFLYFKSYFSYKMAVELKKEAHDKETIFHFMQTHVPSLLFYLIFIGKKQVIASHLGNANPLWKLSNKAKIKYYLLYFAEKNILKRYYKKVYTICKDEEKYYEIIKVPVKKNIIYGVSREEQFEIKNRLDCRKKLGLHDDKKIILQVSRAVHYRGIEWLIKIMDYYSNHNNDIMFVLVGVNKWDPYYEELKKRNCILVEYTDHRKLVDFYNAADLFVLFTKGEKYLKFGGTGYVVIESLLCGTPVVAHSLHHIDNMGITEVAKIPKGEDDIIPMIDDLINKPPERNRCRDIALNIFSWDTVIKKYWQDYTS